MSPCESNAHILNVSGTSSIYSSLVVVRTPSSCITSRITSARNISPVDESSAKTTAVLRRCSRDDAAVITTSCEQSLYRSTYIGVMDMRSGREDVLKNKSLMSCTTQSKFSSVHKSVKHAITFFVCLQHYTLFCPPLLLHSAPIVSYKFKNCTFIWQKKPIVTVTIELRINKFKLYIRLAVNS